MGNTVMAGNGCVENPGVGKAETGQPKHAFLTW